MKALTIMQPWATLIAIGAKTIETRSWRTHYRGLLAIHAGKRITEKARQLCQQAAFYRPLLDAGYQRMSDLPTGQIVAVAELFYCQSTDSLWWAGKEEVLGDFTPGRWGWLLTDIHRLATPIPCKGYQGLWTVDPEIEAMLKEAIN